MTKSAEETMEIYAAFDLTRCPWSAAQLAGCDPKTVERWVAIRDAGGNPFVPPRRPRLIDPFLEKIEELVERSSGKIRADIVHDRHIVPMGFTGTSGPPGGRWPRPRKRSWWAGGGRIGRGSRSRGCGCSSTGPRVPRSAAG